MASPDSSGDGTTSPFGNGDGGSAGGGSANPEATPSGAEPEPGQVAADGQRFAGLEPGPTHVCTGGCIHQGQTGSNMK